MRADTCEVIVYTQSGALSFEVIASGIDFEERLAAALEQGTVLLDTAEGSKLVLCAINVVAIEVREIGAAAAARAAEKNASDTPPVAMESVVCLGTNQVRRRGVPKVGATPSSPALSQDAFPMSETPSKMYFP